MANAGNRVVAHMRDGTLIRGITDDFRPGRETFSVSTSPDHVRVRVPVSELKALFFVKSLTGDRAHVQSNTFADGTKVGRWVWVVFADGEELAGRVLSAKSGHDGFFLFPSDPVSNLERAWVVTSNTRKVLFDEDAARAAERYGPGDRDDADGAIAPGEWDRMLRARSVASPQAWDKAIPRRGTRREPDIFLGEW
jgi:Family of unknown function (DUF6982)